MIPELTKSEFAVLKVLWKQQPRSVREVHDELVTGWAYTTTKTVMDRMVGKGLLVRDTLHGVIIYRAQIGRVEGLVQWVRFLAESVLETDQEEVVNMFVKRKLFSKDEMSELRRLLDTHDESDTEG